MEVPDRDCGRQTSARDIVRVISEHMRCLFRPTQVDEDSVRTTLQTGYGCVPDAWREIIEMPIKTAVVFKETAKNLSAEPV